MFKGPLRTTSKSQQLTLSTMHVHAPDSATVSCGCCRLSCRMWVFWRKYPSWTPRGVA